MRLFSKSCIKKISTHLKIQQHKTFEKVISQAKIIEEVMVQNSYLKVVKKENNNHSYGSKGGGSIGSRPQGD